MLNSFNKTLNQYLGGTYIDVFHSLIALLIIISFYYFISFFIRRKIENITQKRKFLVNLRNICMIVLFLIEVFLWSGEIKTLFISATAIFAACLVAFKDLIMSFVGSLFITSNKLFTLGNIIQVGEIKGKVLDKNLFFTKLSVKDGLGRKELLIPNKYFIDTSFINYSTTNNFTTLNLDFVIPQIHRIQEISEKIEEKIKTIAKEQEILYIQENEQKHKDNIFIEQIKKFYDIKFKFDSENSQIIIQLYVKEELKNQVEKEIIDIYFKEMKL